MSFYLSPQFKYIFNIFICNTECICFIISSLNLHIHKLIFKLSLVEVKKNKEIKRVIFVI